MHLFLHMADIAVGPPVCTYEGVQYLDQEEFHPPSKMQAYHNGSSTDNPFCTECQCIVSRILYIIVLCINVE